MATFLTAAHKMTGERLKKYIETGDQELVKDLKLDSFKQYKEAAELLRTLAEQDSGNEIVVQERKPTVKEAKAEVKAPASAQELLALMSGKEK